MLKLCGQKKWNLACFLSIAYVFGHTVGFLLSFISFCWKLLTAIGHGFYVLGSADQEQIVLGLSVCLYVGILERISLHVFYKT